MHANFAVNGILTLTMKGRKVAKTHHAKEYGLDVLRSEDDLFRWFLMAYMLGKPIQSNVAVQTWQIFIDHGLDNPWSIDTASEHELSRLLVMGKYTRYNHVMSKSLKTVSKQLIDRYEGSIILIIQHSENEEEFTKLLVELYGVGPKTAEIFMRETVDFFARRRNYD